MSNDVEQRLERLEQSYERERVGWLRQAAEEHNWHEPKIASKVIDPSSIATRADARKAIADYSTENPNFVNVSSDPAMRLGQALLDRMDRDTGGRWRPQ